MATHPEEIHIRTPTRMKRRMRGCTKGCEPQEHRTASWLLPRIVRRPSIRPLSGSPPPFPSSGSLTVHQHNWHPLPKNAFFIPPTGLARRLGKNGCRPSSSVRELTAVQSRRGTKSRAFCRCTAQSARPTQGSFHASLSDVGYRPPRRGTTRFLPRRQRVSAHPRSERLRDGRGYRLPSGAAVRRQPLSRGRLRASTVCSRPPRTSFCAGKRFARETPFHPACSWRTALSSV
jgi:hypothetical protein